jgi:hypothetical protein
MRSLIKVTSTFTFTFTFTHVTCPQVASHTQQLQARCGDHLCVPAPPCGVTYLTARHTRQAAYLRQQFLDKQAGKMLSRLQVRCRPLSKHGRCMR